jgi:S1-C subfamily serine protease
LLFVLLLTATASAEEKPKPGYLGIQIARGEEGVIVIAQVIDKSPAAKAGLKSGDRLVRINGVKPVTLVAAVAAVRSLKPGKKVKLLIERDGKEKTIEATPGSAE